MAWLGAALVVLADGRRGLALAMAVTAVGLAASVFAATDPLSAGVLLAGGMLAAARRQAVGPEGWGLMPAGSTPRFILCVAVGLVAAWFVLAVTTGAGAGLRFACVTVLSLTAARVLSSGEPAILLSAAGVLALAVAAAAGVSGTSVGPWPYLAAAFIAAGAGWVRPEAGRAP